LRVKAGIRYNNLRDNKTATTNRFTGAFFGDFQATDKLGFNLRYNNNRISSERNKDSLTTNYLYNSIGISTRYNFTFSSIRNNINVTYNFKDSKNRNSKQDSDNKNVTNSVSLIHSFFLQSDWQFATNLFYSNSELPRFNTTITNISETVVKRLFEAKLNLSVTLGYSSSVSADKTNKNIILKFASSYSFGNYGRLSAKLSNNHYEADRLENAVYSELYGSINYRLNF